MSFIADSNPGIRQRLFARLDSMASYTIPNLIAYGYQKSRKPHSTV
ncbi:hypothetical protein NDA00_04715 [Funiculus sociatus GB2-M2]|nr:hypothetical protein [Trichocoleus sp. FACHB-90]